MGEIEGQSSRYVVLGIGWVLRETQEWAEVVHSGQDRKTSPTGYGLHGWDGPDHRERLKILGTLGIRVLVERGRMSLLLVRGRGRRLLLHTSFKTRARIEHE